ncbi:phage tail tube protein [Agrobacterium sp. Azo12]|uniref:phage tail tube protein n=1 Tax=Agrobacterium sp. Azo12 TaxID=3031129 RepID=UPI0023D82EA0|nr:phage tail tube protein [Agrobacterium sp. Azo12]MDO5895122.1 phage tail tube protein [Agrobacterium sp. Azo12]
MTDARIGYGTIYEIFDPTLTTPAFVELAEVINVTPGEATADRIDATHMQSPNRRREYISGLIDNGEASFEINWVPGSNTDVRIRDLFESGETVEHRITFPGPAPRVTVTYEASIIGFSKAIPIDDRMTATITVAVSGAETWGTAA